MPVVKSIPQVIHAMVGTAGHVDHGKTSLVKLLTGCETDRLPEEKARGMSIDLGFAPCLLSGRRVVGIVDVPGHKDFIRNMVAGAASIDVLMLVVAADDGVMPQTDEHVKIVRLLRRPLVMVALTKIDLVEPEMLDLAEQDVRSFMTRMGYPDAPIVRVSNKTGEGVSQVLDTVQNLVDRVRREPDQRAFRMNVERVFSVKGYGTVVTGIPVSGQVRIGQKLALLPAGTDLTVRAIQCYKHESDTAWAHACCAINVRDVQAAQVARGMTAAWPGVFHATSEAIVLLQNVSGEHVLKHRTVALLHSGTGAIEASVKLLDLDELPPGRQALAHVALTEPLVLAAGDRLLLRAISPAETLGGGVVLSAQAPRHRRATIEILDRLSRAAAAVESGNLALSELLAGPDAIVRRDYLVRLTQCDESAAAAVVARLEDDGHIINLRGGAWAVAARIGELIARIEPLLRQYHQQHPFDWGMTPDHACGCLGTEPGSFDALAKLLAGTGTIGLKYGRLALADFCPPVSAHLLQLRDRVLSMIQNGGVNGPARGNLMKDLGIREPDMQTLQRLLLGDGSVMFLDGNFILRSVYDDCRSKLLRLFESAKCVELDAFREAIGSNRKMAVAMLDAFDAEGLTRRTPDGRVLVRQKT